MAFRREFIVIELKEQKLQWCDDSTTPIKEKKLNMQFFHKFYTHLTIYGNIVLIK